MTSGRGRTSTAVGGGIVDAGAGVERIAQTGGVATTVLGFFATSLRAGVRWAMTPGTAGTPLGLTLSLTNL